MSGRVHTKELLWDYKEGKKGALSDLVVTALDERNGIIYVASVYSQGGNKVLYMIRYSIEGTRTHVEWKITELNVGKYGPLSLYHDTRNHRIFALCQGDDNDRHSTVIYLINSQDGSIIDGIPISRELHTVSPYEGHLITINEKRNDLVAVVHGELHIIDRSTKHTRKILRNNTYQFITSSHSTHNMYVITEKEDLELSNPKYNCLHVLKPNLEDLQIARFGSEIELKNINFSDNTICVQAKHREKDNEYSFWLFNEIQTN